MRSLFIRWLLPLFLSSSLYAQSREGYIVTAEGDSLNGFVSYSEYNSPQKVTFGKQKRGDKMVYRMDEVKAFGLSFASRIVALEVPAKGGVITRVLARQVVAGKMDLFTVRGKFYVRQDGEVYELIEDRLNAPLSEKFRGYYKDVLERFFEGCISAENAKYEQTSLKNLINNYSRCHRVEPRTFQDPPRGTRVNLVTIGGVEKSDIIFNDGAVLPTAFRPAFGLGLNVYTPDIGDRLFFTMEALYGKRSGTGFMDESASSYRKVYSTYTIDFDMVRVPVGIGYYLTNPDRSPFYLKVGISKAFVLSSSIEYIRETESYKVVTTESGNNTQSIKGGTALWASLGFATRVYRSHHAFLEVRWENGSASASTTDHNYVVKMTNVGLYAGISF